ncbi:MULTISPECIES: protein translocase subunit SecD [Shewanella]|jgi:preprotein translocase subunit SecD|uniref:Protein translocase subunit SecD n=1 Tax=Shewanella oncorhynchi TaxID=2726434 RepID=A0AA50KFQ9_9GAMM|nr:MULTISPECIES: protein translocase subunit SecD [Shewanella]AVI66832.1 protein translocase subunit SecD [Shewanella sp. WE21]MBI1675100.1 protein translocase subunit SecD [Shewanella sp. DW31]MBP8117800.1 protein translocase subunit SecD [Shewanella sp.]MBS0040793.1 protein translocase subunit SecD [Shewanella sp. M16]MBW3531451.1 protein translocase subunit SecD [Shewanella sp. NKUCC06_TVS]
MERKPNQRLLNHYSAWKYLVLIVTIIVMLFSALPTFYGEDAAVQVGAKAGLTLTPIALRDKLQAEGVTVKRIDQKNGETLIVLDADNQQTLVKTLVSSMVAEPKELTLSLASAAPSWLQNLGFQPIKLGLDLRGGVQFLLDVDIDPVYQTQAETLVDSLRQFIREQKIRGASVHLDQSHQLNMTLPDNDARAAVRQMMKESYPNWQLSNADGAGLLIKLSQEEQTKLRNLTVQQNLQVMRSRIEELGITEALVQRQGEHRIRIELPGVQDPAAAKNVIGATASLAFFEVKESGSVNAMVLNDKSGKPIYVSRTPVLGGDHIVDARASLGEMGMAEVNINLDRVGGQKMSEFSRTNIGKPMATSYSEYSRDEQGKAKQTQEIISVATIQSQLGDRFRITGAGSYQEAQQLALLLRAGSMTAPVTIVEERTIGPTLGAENIENGFAALGLGMGITLLFMALWYRRLGWVANIALISNMVILFGLLALIPGAVLTLPGIAGLVLTVGMAVDTNVLIFERIKDKLKEGRSFALAIDTGFDSAFSTIFDANFTTMITAVVLYSIGNGPIQGFALTLGLGLLTSMFTGIFASRALINLVYGRDASRHVKV